MTRRAKTKNGLSNSEFARREGMSPTAIRKAKIEGRLSRLPDGSLDPALVGTSWTTQRKTDRAHNREIKQCQALRADLAAAIADLPEEHRRRIGDAAEAWLTDLHFLILRQGGVSPASLAVFVSDNMAAPLQPYNDIPIDEQE